MAGQTRITEVVVQAGLGSAVAAKTRITDIVVTTEAAALVPANTRITEVMVQAGPVSQYPVGLPSVYYWGTDGNMHPFQLLTTDDLPWP